MGHTVTWETAKAIRSQYHYTCWVFGIHVVLSVNPIEQHMWEMSEAKTWTEQTAQMELQAPGVRIIDTFYFWVSSNNWKCARAYTLMCPCKNSHIESCPVGGVLSTTRKQVVTSIIVTPLLHQWTSLTRLITIVAHRGHSCLGGYMLRYAAPGRLSMLQWTMFGSTSIQYR